MSSSLFSLVFVVAGVLVAACAVALLHVLLRPADAERARASAALVELEPRGGRHRFHARLFEVAALVSVASTGIMVLALWTAVSSRLSTVGRGAAAVAAAALVASVWWAWRRGSLRAAGADEPLDGTIDVSTTSPATTAPAAGARRG